MVQTVLDENPKNMLFSRWIVQFSWRIWSVVHQVSGPRQHGIPRPKTHKAQRYRIDRPTPLWHRDCPRFWRNIRHHKWDRTSDQNRGIGFDQGRDFDITRKNTEREWKLQSRNQRAIRTGGSQSKHLISRSGGMNTGQWVTGTQCWYNVNHGARTMLFAPKCVYPLKPGGHLSPPSLENQTTKQP